MNVNMKFYPLGTAWLITVIVSAGATAQQTQPSDDPATSQGLRVVDELVVPTEVAQTQPGDVGNPVDPVEPQSEAAESLGGTSSEPLQDGLVPDGRLPDGPDETGEAMTTEPDEAVSTQEAGDKADGHGGDVKDAPVSQSGHASLSAVRARIASLIESYPATPASARAQAAGELWALANQCLRLAATLPDIASRVEAVTAALRVSDDLVRGAGNAGDAQRYLSLLRAAACQVTEIGGEGTEALSKFWLLGADLSDINIAEIDTDARQRLAIRRLEQFLDEPADTSPSEDLSGPAPIGDGDVPGVDATSWAVSEAVRWALLGLYDQRGYSDRARGLVSQLKSALPVDDTAGRAYLDRWFGYCPIIGQRFESRLLTDDGRQWSSEDHLGKVVLLHFWADWAGSSVQSIDAVRPRYDQLHDRGLEVLSVRIPGEEAGGELSEAVPWASCTQTPEGPDLIGLFAIASLPRFVVIDAAGRVAAIGSSPAILDQFEHLLPEAQPISPTSQPGLRDHAAVEEQPSPEGDRENPTESPVLSPPSSPEPPAAASTQPD